MDNIKIAVNLLNLLKTLNLKMQYLSRMPTAYIITYNIIVIDPSGYVI